MTDALNPGARPRSFYAYVIVGAVAFALIDSFYLLAPTILSFLLIILVSLAVNPFIIRLRAITGGRGRATVLMAGAAVLMLSLTAWAFVDPIRTSVYNFTERLPGYWDRLQKPLIMMEKQAELSEERLQAEVTTEIAQIATAAGDHERVQRAEEPPAPKTPTEGGGYLRSMLSDTVKGVFGRFSAMAFDAAQILTVLITVVFGVFFTLMNPRPIFGAMISLVPERHHETTLTILSRIAKFVPGWAGATLLGMLTIGLLTMLLMWPIMGFTDALVLAVMAGLLECIPFLGPVLASIPAMLLAVGQGGTTLVWVLGAYIGVQALENNVIMPFIMARGMKLHPVAVIFSMLLCVATFGVLGVLVAAPLVAILSIVHEELYRKRFLPGVTDSDLDRLARLAMGERQSMGP